VIYGLVELDVTDVRRYFHDYRERNGESLSFTAFLAGALARAMEEHPMTHARRDILGRLVIFHEIDIVVMIEAEQDGVAIPHIVRNAAQKSFMDIHREIRSVQEKPDRSDQRKGLTRLGAFVPGFMRRLFFLVTLRSPRLVKRHMGSAVCTSPGMFTRGPGSAWGIGFLPVHTLGLTVGSITEKPVFAGEKVVKREFLSVTLAFDHDIVDGAPAARFAETFRKRVETPPQL
jgi:pyruvate/2-oxoglutarate dehydrogenase complex dihydrolipoamide acyltransferase (E2) component